MRKASQIFLCITQLIFKCDFLISFGSSRTTLKLMKSQRMWACFNQGLFCYPAFVRCHVTQIGSHASKTSGRGSINYTPFVSTLSQHFSTGPIIAEVHGLKRAGAVMVESLSQSAGVAYRCNIALSSTLLLLIVRIKCRSKQDSAAGSGPKLGRVDVQPQFILVHPLGGEL